MAKPNLKGFNQLNDVVSLYRPSEAQVKNVGKDDKSPTLIVYCSWMGAAPKHIGKYVEGYQRLFPASSILLVESSVSGMFFSMDISPAIEVISEQIQQSNSSEGNKRILLAMASNGGCKTAMILSNKLQNLHSRVPFDCMILDCCPGKPVLESGAKAVSYSLPNYPLVRTIGYYFLYVLILIYYGTVIHVLGIEDYITEARRAFNTASLFPKTIPRVYLYSKADALIDAAHVHEHAEQARQVGYKVVREEVFEKAPHTALLMEDGERYWGAVQSIVAVDV